MFRSVALMEEREKLVQEFLKNRAELKQRQVDFKVSRQHEGEFFERASKPFVNAKKSVAEAIKRNKTKKLNGCKKSLKRLRTLNSSLPNG